MKIHRIESIPKGYEYNEATELADYELEYLEKLDIDEIWYWYGTGSYEGSGQILMRKGDMYDLHDMGHCSCYGPTDNVEFKGSTLDELKIRAQNIKIETELLFNVIV